MGNVTQPWLNQLSYMQQTVLLECVRGPDTLPKYHVAKYLLRWYRRCILLSAFDKATIDTPFAEGGGSFTGPSCSRPKDGVSWQPEMDEVVAQYLRAVDEMPHHFHLHFVHAAEIVGYKHPDPGIRDWWFGVYVRLVDDMHLHRETEAELDSRLGDTREGWLARADPATVA